MTKYIVAILLALHVCFASVAFGAEVQGQEEEQNMTVATFEALVQLDENFEETEPGYLPAGWGTTISGGNKVEVAADPLDAGNKALLIERHAANTNSRLNIPVDGGQHPPRTVVSMDIMIESPAAGALFYNSVGTNAVQWVIAGQTDGFALSNRRSDAGLGTRIGDQLPYGAWHHLQIEYVPDGVQHTMIRYYVNGELELSTNDYFNKGVATNEPAAAIDSLRFDNFKAAGSMKLYVDNVRLTVDTPDDTKAELQSLLHEMDELVSEDVFEWLISLYDIEKGGFYYSVSARDHEEFLPDLESTSFALQLLAAGGILPNGYIPDNVLSPGIKNRIIQSVQSMQDPEDGFFYHAHWKKDITTSRKNRDLSEAVAILNRMGAQPLYLLPSERLAQNGAAASVMADVPIYLTSPEELLIWMNDTWNNSTPYGAGNTFSSARGQITAAGLLDTAVAFITDKQNPETGLWGEGLAYINANAAMKLQGFYAASHTPYPHIDKMIASMTTIIIEEGEPAAVVDVWNPIVAITGALDSYETISPELQAAIDQSVPQLTAVTIDKVKPFKRTDSGYSYFRTNSSPTSQGAYVGYGLEEGDVNATVIGTTRLRSSLYKMAGIAPGPLFNGTSFAAALIQQWETLPPVVKVERPIGLDENFEETEPGGLPAEWMTTISDGNKVEVAADPLDAGNKALLIERVAANTSSRLNIPVYGGNHPPETIVSLDLMIESPAAGALFYNSIGTNAVQWVIAGQADGFTLSNRRSESGLGAPIGEKLAYGAWHHLQIEYVPDGVQHTIIHYYVNGELKLSTNEYFNKGVAANEPADAIDNLRFDNFKAAGSLKLYVDNLRLTVETPDQTPPVSEATPDAYPGPGGWYTADPTIAITSSDPLSGVAATEYQVNGGSWFSYEGPVTVTNEGVTTLTYRSTDHAGNIEAAKSVTIQLDKTAPVFTLLLNGTPLSGETEIHADSPVTFQLQASDNVSGVAQQAIRVDGAPYTEGTTLNWLGSPGAHTVQADVYDVAGNRATAAVAIRVTTNLELVQRLMKSYEDDGSIGHQMAAQLRNRLEQVGHHLGKGSAGQAMKHMEQFQKQIDNNGLQDRMTADVKQMLLLHADALLETWRSNEDRRV